MIAEKSDTAQRIIDQVSATSPKVTVDNTVLGNALLRLEQKGLPGSKNEDYKYCNIDAYFKKHFRDLKQELIEPGDINALKLEDTITLVVVNGRYSEALSDKAVINGLTVLCLDQDPGNEISVSSLADVQSDSLIALNTAFTSGGISISVDQGIDLQIPIHVIFVSAAAAPSLVQPRCLVRIGAGAGACIIEHFVNAGPGKVFNNYVSEKLVASGAKLESYILQEEGPNGFSAHTQQVEVKGSAHYDNTTITLSGELVRNNHNVAMSGRDGQCHLYGLFHADGTQLIDNHTLVDHREPYCESNELYKGIASGKSTGVFNGKIFVRQDAQKTNAYQSSKNILLSDDATINTKPQLEIYANDVKCSHGTSTGKIDENALFYLNSRGIGMESARRLLLSSFAGEVLGRIQVDALRERATAGFEQRLS
jgi:Fe-S cluster assembly protein SufD